MFLVIMVSTEDGGRMSRTKAETSSAFVRLFRLLYPSVDDD